MPGAVLPVSPVSVMPKLLARSFTQNRQWEVDENLYIDASYQSTGSGLVLTSRKSWSLTGRLTASEMSTLLAFYLAHVNPTGTGVSEFWFYDLYETVPQFTYDPTGSATSGRFAVRFDGSFQQTADLARWVTQLKLVEVD